MTRLFVASRNVGKLAELRRIVSDVVPGVDVLGLDDVATYDEPVESERTFEGNALLKARAGLAASGVPCLADDSGLCVDELNGMPGVLSARWAGLDKSDDANNALLLDQLHDTPEERRSAVFRCAVALCLPSGREEVVTGEMHGSLLREPKGSGGFGYDALFVSDGHTRTAAELSQDEKDLVSHRGKALRAIAPLVASALRPASDTRS